MPDARRPTKGALAFCMSDLRGLFDHTRRAREERSPGDLAVGGALNRRGKVDGDASPSFAVQHSLDLNAIELVELAEDRNAAPDLLDVCAQKPRALGDSALVFAHLQSGTVPKCTCQAVRTVWGFRVDLCAGTNQHVATSKKDAEESKAEKKAAGKRIKALRESIFDETGKKLTQDEAAELGGIEREYWVKAESGIGLSAGRIQKALALGMGIDLVDLLEYSEQRIQIKDVLVRRHTKLDERYPGAMIAVRAAARQDNLWKHYLTFTAPLLDSDEGPSAIAMLRLFSDHVVREKNKGVVELVSDLDRPKKRRR